MQRTTGGPFPIMKHRANGFALIDVIFVCGIIGVLSIIALPRLTLARQTASAASAIGSMRAINSAQLTFALTCGGGFYAPNLTTLGQTSAGSREAFIVPQLSVADEIIHSNYRIQILATPFPGAPASCNGLGSGEAAQGFAAVADPIEATNSRYFATNANSQIWEHTTSFLAAMPELGEPAIGHPLQ
jgi:type II secretory pathway pseudopilin PulG